MPIPWAAVDNNFPTLSEEEPQRDQIRKLVNYMAILTEQLKYTLNNLDANNWNAAAYDEEQGTLTDLQMQLNTMGKTLETQGLSLEELQEQLKPVDITQQIEFSTTYPQYPNGAVRFIKQGSIVRFDYASTKIAHATGEDKWLFKIPEGLRPSELMAFPACTTGYTGHIVINTDGVAFMEALSSTSTAQHIITSGWWMIAEEE